MRRFGERFGETLRMALGIATVLSLWVLLLMVINSGTELTVRGRAYSGFVVIAIYYLGGGLAALIVAALLPLTRHPAGAAVVGVLSALPVTLAVVVGADGVGSLGPMTALRPSLPPLRSEDCSVSGSGRCSRSTRRARGSHAHRRTIEHPPRDEWPWTGALSSDRCV